MHYYPAMLEAEGGSTAQRAAHRVPASAPSASFPTVWRASVQSLLQGWVGIEAACAWCVRQVQTCWVSAASIFRGRTDVVAAANLWDGSRLEPQNLPLAALRLAACGSTLVY